MVPSLIPAVEFEDVFMVKAMENAHFVQNFRLPAFLNTLDCYVVNCLLYTSLFDTNGEFGLI